MGTDGLRVCSNYRNSQGLQTRTHLQVMMMRIVRRNELHWFCTFMPGLIISAGRPLPLCRSNQDHVYVGVKSFQTDRQMVVLREEINSMGWDEVEITVKQ